MNKLSPADRARRYLEKMPPAVSGQRGHDQTFAAACVLTVGFALGEREAWPLLLEYNRRCAPPWSEKDLRHKLADALKKAAAAGAGKLLRAGSSGASAPSRPASPRPAWGFPAQYVEPPWRPPAQGIQPEPIVDLGPDERDEVLADLRAWLLAHSLQFVAEFGAQPALLAVPVREGVRLRRLGIADVDGITVETHEAAERMLY